MEIVMAEETQDSTSSDQAPEIQEETQSEWLVVWPGFDNMMMNELCKTPKKLAETLTDLYNEGQDMNVVKVYKVEEVSFVAERKTEISIGGIGMVDPYEDTPPEL